MAKPRRRRRRRRKARAEHKETRGSSSLGSRIGSTLGGVLGGIAQRGISRIFGRGEYVEALAHEHGVEPEAIHEGETPEVNSLVTPVDSQTAVPIMGMDHEGSIEITRREFIHEVEIFDTPSTRVFRINPGYQGTFPWCAALARNFQKYAIFGLAAEYVPTSGLAVGSENAALGYVGVAFQYNVAELQTGAQWPITSARGILNMNGAVSSSPGAYSTCYMECKPDMTNQPVKFVFTGSIQELYYSQANYDWAVLLVRSEGAQNSVPFICGQMWLTYHIRFFDPRPQDIVLPLYSGDVAQLVQEYERLIQFTGPFSDTGQVKHSVRIEELEALFASPEFVSKRSAQVQERLVRAIECKDEEPDCPVLEEELRKLMPTRDVAKRPLPGETAPPDPPSWKMVRA